MTARGRLIGMGTTFLTDGEVSELIGLFDAAVAEERERVKAVSVGVIEALCDRYQDARFSEAIPAIQAIGEVGAGAKDAAGEGA